VDESVTQTTEYVGLRKISRFFRHIGNNAHRFAYRLDLMLYRTEFGQRDDDIYLVAFPKSGTTMTQVILYQLCTNGQGDMSFHHIYDVSPWIGNDVFRGRPPKELPSPRIIKSHEFYRDYEKNMKGRFIYLYRDGMDVAVSLYHQNKNYNKPDLTFDASFATFMTKNKNNWFLHVRDWVRNKHKFKILYLRFEDLVNSKREQILNIIDFLELDVGEIAIENALKYSSFGYMKDHEKKFGVQPPDLSQRIFDQFIRSGKTGEGAAILSEEQKNEFRKKYQKYLGDIYGSVDWSHQWKRCQRGQT
jgi:hypothetical protein